MSDIDWSKAPEGATHWEDASSEAGESWMKFEDGKWFHWGESGKRWHRDNWISASRIEHLIGKTAAWTGEGLPPVGTVCEVDYCEQWHQCEVIAHFQQRAGMVAAFTVDMGDGVKALDAFGAEYFRPIRTPEQIAAEEREKQLEAMEEVAARAWRSVAPGEDMISVIVAALHADGYRKTEAP